MKFNFSEFKYRCLIYTIVGVIWTILGAMWHLYGYPHTVEFSTSSERYSWWYNLGNLLAAGGLIVLVSIPGGSTPVSGSFITVPIGVLMNLGILTLIGEIVWRFKNRRR